MAADFEEYVFTDKAGKRFCEMIDMTVDRPRLQFWNFYRMHNAVRGMSLTRDTARSQETDNAD